MNVFVIDQDPYVAAEMHCDKHVVKMIIEYAQLLSTAHRLLDGVQSVHRGANTKPKRFWLLPGERVIEREIITEFVDEEACEVITQREYKLVIENPTCYGLTHGNHPSAIWARETDTNYYWLLKLLAGCLNEYEHRYEKKHVTGQLLPFLRKAPKNIKQGELTLFAQAMPVQFKVPNDPVAAYKAFYVGSKSRFAKWTNRPVPEWFATAITKEGRNVADFTRAG